VDGRILAFPSPHAFILVSLMVMQKMREYSKIFLWILVIAFLGWLGLDLGANLTGRKVAKPWERGVIAKVGDFEITYNYYNAYLQRAIADTVRKLGRELTEDELKGLREKVFQEVVEDVRWGLLARDLGLNFSDDAIIKIIAMFPPPEIMQDTLFYTNGKFDFSKYLSLLRTPEAIPFFKLYEERLRRQIPRDIIRFFLAGMGSVSDLEVKYTFMLENTRVKIAYVPLPIKLVPDKDAQITIDEVRQFYKDNKELFSHPERVRMALVRAYLIPSQLDTFNTQDKVEAIMQQLKEGVKFSDAVKYYSDDLRTKKDSGKLGTIYIKDLPEPLQNALSGAKPGELVGPVFFEGGWYIFKVDSVKGDSLTLREIFVRLRVSDETKKAIRDSIMRAIKENKAEEFGFIVDTTPWVNINTKFFPLVGSNYEMRNFVKKAKVGEWSRVFETPNFMVSFGVVERQKPGLMDFEEVKDIAAEKLIARKKKDLLRGKAEEIKKYVEANDTAGIRKVFPDNPSVKLMTSGYIKKGVGVPGVPFQYRDKFFADILHANVGETRIFEHPVGFVVYKKLDEKKPDEKEFEAIKPFFKVQLSQKYANLILSAFEDELKERYPLEDYRDYLNMR